MSITTSPDVAFDRAAFNADTAEWTDGSLALIKANSKSIEETGQMQRELARRIHQRFGVAVGVGFVFPRYAVYRMKGAGAGQGGRKGSKWWSNARTVTHTRGALKGQTTKGGWKKTATLSLGKAGTGNRNEYDWLNPILDKRMDLLADIMVNHYGSFVEGAFKDIKIK